MASWEEGDAKQGLGKELGTITKDYGISFLGY